MNADDLRAPGTDDEPEWLTDYHVVMDEQARRDREQRRMAMWLMLLTFTGMIVIAALVILAGDKL